MLRWVALRSLPSHAPLHHHYRHASAMIISTMQITRSPGLPTPASPSLLWAPARNYCSRRDDDDHDPKDTKPATDKPIDENEEPTEEQPLDVKEERPPVEESARVIPSNDNFSSELIKTPLFLPSRRRKTLPTPAAKASDSLPSDGDAASANALPDMNPLPDDKIPSDVLLLPLEFPVLPGASMTLAVSPHAALKILEYQQKGGEYLGLFCRQPAPEKNTIHTVGTLARLNNVSTSFASGQGFSTRVTLSFLDRIHLAPGESTYTEADHPRSIAIAPFHSDAYDSTTSEVVAFRLELQANITKLLRSSESHSLQFSHVKKIDPKDLALLADVGAVLCTSADPSAIQHLLQESSVVERAQKALSLVLGEVEALSSRPEPHPMQNMAKLFGSSGGSPGGPGMAAPSRKPSPVEKRWEDRLLANPPPAHVLTVIREEMEKFGSSPPASSEHGLIRNYVDWLTQLPWSHTTQDNFDIQQASHILNAHHYGLQDVKKRILEFIAVGAMKRNIQSATAQGKILCLVGSPGVGKTSIGRSIAEALGRKFHRVSVGGMRDVSEIKGHRRTYVGAMPGKFIQGLKQSESLNPVILIDEIEKLSRGREGDPAAALLEVLDPEQNKDFMDHYLDVPVDLSQVLFLCTGNSLATIPDALLDRMEVIEVPGYTTYEKIQIANDYLIPRIAKETGLPEESVKFAPGQMEALIDEYCREPGVRVLQQKLESLYRQVAVKMVKGQSQELEVTAENMRQCLGKPSFSIAEAFVNAPAGVVVGLGYTAYGGNILILETLAHPGEEGKGGSVKLTGSLGDVLRESASIAQTYARLLLQKHDPDNAFFDENNISIHLPHGAVKKEGPSAGIALVTALMSLATGQRVDPHLAMTGEVTLTGRVMGVGGIKEKMLGAQRSGIRHICLPEENRFDYEELDDRLKDSFDSVQFFSRYEDLYRFLFHEHVFNPSLSEPEQSVSAPPAPAPPAN